MFYKHKHLYLCTLTLKFIRKNVPPKKVVINKK